MRIDQIFIKLVVLAISFAVHYAHASYLDQTTPNGQVRIHYSTTTPASCDAILLGVGTSMSISSYDKLSEEIIK
ncbi:MAG: hypothetical protein IPI97_09140 [Nitrosomonas sp.]|jgi:hypothetical protein|nr:hypothetical protein [Nitrosomonas sp.]MBK7365139.1 hypothetical protein [Nitrosomonas sp.]